MNCIQMKRSNLYCAFFVILIILFCFLIYTLFFSRTSDIQQVKPELHVGRKPHILLLMVDDLGWNDIGYHNSRVHTPFLNELALGGVRLESYYVQPTSTGSRAQLLTGRHEIHLGLQHGNIKSRQANGLPLDVRTLADKLREAGYATHLVGKWHLGHHRKEYLPTSRGFDTFFGYLTDVKQSAHHRNCDAVNASAGNSTCSYDFYDGSRPYLEASGYESMELFAKRSVKLIDNHTINDLSRNFFLQVSFQTVHGFSEIEARYEHKKSYIKNARSKKEEILAEIDKAVKTIVDALKKQGFWDNTLTIFTAVNGGDAYHGSNNYPLRGQAGTLWEGGLRAICFAHGAGLQFVAGSVTEELYHISDWFPTLLGLAGHPPTDDVLLHGFDIWPSLSMKFPSPRTEILHNIDPLVPLKGKRLDYSPFDNRITAALRLHSYKLLTGNPGDADWYSISPTISTNSGKQANQTMLIDSSVAINIYRANADSADKNLWLFHLDWCSEETVDVSQQNPSVVLLMLTKLAAYHSTSASCRYPPNDPKADPLLHEGEMKGVVGPWDID